MPSVPPTASPSIDPARPDVTPAIPPSPASLAVDVAVEPARPRHRPRRARHPRRRPRRDDGRPRLLRARRRPGVDGLVPTLRHRSEDRRRRPRGDDGPARRRGRSSTTTATALDRDPGRHAPARAVDQERRRDRRPVDRVRLGRRQRVGVSSPRAGRLHADPVHDRPGGPLPGRGSDGRRRSAARASSSTARRRGATSTTCCRRSSSTGRRSGRRPATRPASPATPTCSRRPSGSRSWTASARSSSTKMTMATCGTGCRGTFDVTFSYDVAQGPVGHAARVLRIGHGRQPEDIRDYPVWLTPNRRASEIRARRGGSGRFVGRFVIIRRLCQTSISVGAWRSLVARIVRDDEVGGSNPLAPTIPTSSSSRPTRSEHHDLAVPSIMARGRRRGRRYAFASHAILGRVTAPSPPTRRVLIAGCARCAS